MDILEILGIEQRIKQGEKTSPQERYARIDISLDNPEYIGKDIPIEVDGDFLAKIRYDGSATGCYFKFGNKRSSPIYVSEFKQRHTPLSKFTKILLTNVSAQSGKHFIFNVGDGIVGDIEPSTGRKTGVTDGAGDDINPAKEDGNIATLAGLGAVDGGGDLQKVKEELEKILLDTAGMETDLAAIELLNTDIKTALEIIDNAISGTKMQTEEQFSGTPYNKHQTSTTSMVAFAGSTKKLRDIVIKNTDAANAVDIGKTEVDDSTFRANAFELKAGASIGFTMIDLHLLKLLPSVAGNHATVHLIGVEV